MRLEPLDGPFGCAIHGVDLSQMIDDETFRAITQALYDHRVVVIRGQRLDKDAFLAFGRRWGEPIPHVLDHLRMPGYPEMLEIGNLAPHAGDAEVRNGAAFWHTDQSYEAVPASATMLYAIKMPEVGGETRIADTKTAYDDLDDATKQRIEGLNAMHFYGATAREDGPHIAAPLKNKDQEDKVPPIPHPIARPHEVTGTKALFAVSGTAYAVEGMAGDEGKSLLTGLKTHALQDKYVYEHRYEVGDIAIWDTQMTLHCAKPIDLPDGASTERQLWRISVRGKPAIYQ